MAPRACVVCVAIVWLAGASYAAAPPVKETAPSTQRLERLNRGFLEFVGGLDAGQSLQAGAILQAWSMSYEKSAPQSFVPDSLTLLSPDYRLALEQFDAGAASEARTRFDALTRDQNGWIAANSAYFFARTLVDAGMFEEAQRFLANLGAAREELDARTPYAPHLWLILAYSQARNLEFDAAAATLKMLGERYADAPEAVRVGARELSLELERREHETLGDIARHMNYVADRLGAADGGAKVRGEQGQVVAMLDKLIEKKQQSEQQKQQGKGGGQRRAGKGERGQGQRPMRADQPRTQSEVAPGEGKIGELHGAPSVKPGESWGELPPAEREKILQAIRERFPSRYRELVEQYYRGLAQEK